MVRHGRNRKRRAGRIGRTSLKQTNFKRWNPNPKINDATVKKLWDTKLTPNQNLANMGLTMIPNKEKLSTYTTNSIDNNRSQDESTTTSDTKKKPNMIELFDVPDSDELAKNKKPRLPLTAEEQATIVKCLAKHGTDYDKMFRDTSGSNKLQHTRQKLQKMGARFLLLEPDQLRIPVEEVPKRVRQLMEHAEELEEMLFLEERDT